jgi:hypothetical protein
VSARGIPSSFNVPVRNRDVSIFPPDLGLTAKKTKFQGRVASVATHILLDFDGRCVSFWLYFAARLSCAPFFDLIPGSAYLVPD